MRVLSQLISASKKQKNKTKQNKNKKRGVPLLGLAKSISYN